MLRKGRKLKRIADRAARRLEKEKRPRTILKKPTGESSVRIKPISREEGESSVRIKPISREELEYPEAKTNRERISRLQEEEALARKNEAEERQWQEFDEFKVKASERIGENRQRNLEKVLALNEKQSEKYRTILNNNPEYKLSFSEMRETLLSGKNPILNIKTLEVDTERLRKKAENVAKRNKKFRKIKNENTKEDHIRAIIVTQYGNELQKVKAFQDKNRLERLKALPTKRTPREFYGSEAGREFTPDSSTKTPRLTYLKGQESVDTPMFPRETRRADILVSKKDPSQKIPFPTLDVRNAEIRKLLNALEKRRQEKGVRPPGTKRYPVREQSTSKYDEATGEFIEPPIKLDPKTKKPIMGLSEKEKRIKELENILIDEGISDKDLINLLKDAGIPYTTIIENRLVNPKTKEVIRDLGSIKGSPVGRRITQEIDREALTSQLRQNYRGRPQIDKEIPNIKTRTLIDRRTGEPLIDPKGGPRGTGAPIKEELREPFLERIKSPLRDPKTGKEIFPSQYDDPKGAELTASDSIYVDSKSPFEGLTKPQYEKKVDELISSGEGLLGSKSPFENVEVVSESLDLRKNSDRLRGKEISDDIPQDQVIKLQQTNLVEVKGNKIVWTKAADKYNKKVLERDHNTYVNNLIKNGFAKKVKDSKTGKTKIVYTSEFDDYFQRQSWGVEKGNIFNEPKSTPRPEYSKGGKISINETGNLKPSELEEFLNEQGYKVNFKHGGKIKIKCRPKPKILQSGRVSNNKRHVGVGAAKRGFGAVRVV